ncbi:MAG TPA: sulfatase-like hydrolase/transferase, partial [Thermoanaerobaculia bacterium]|nr:sulfatase-like hydrolase/transferase [Thermoanaerobaculia bacterium]
RLSFLSGDWALPQPGEDTLVGLCRKQGFWTTLVTDNYVATVPRLGGMLLDEFDTVDFIRGAGSDPWITPSVELLAAAQEMARVRPTRSALFEAQFIANCRRWPEGKPPFERVFEKAGEHLRELVRHERFLLWVDTFACHEPWASLADLETAASVPEEPLFPGYVEAGLYSRQHLAALRARFARRIGETDHALGPLVSELESAMRGGDVGLVVLSDHGFLFGEFGFVGKPANTPLPPELHEILCWLSGQFAERTFPELGIQPHSLHWLLRDALGIEGSRMAGSDLHLFARNSPRSNYLAAASQDEIYILEKALAGTGVEFRTIHRSNADRHRQLASQGEPAISTSVRESIRAVLSGGTSPWLLPFREAL